MKALFQKLKRPIIAIVIILFLFFIFRILSNNGATSDSPLLKDPKARERSASARELVALLNKVSTVKFDTSVFSSVAYKSLSSFAQTIVDEPRGKRNPFGPSEFSGSSGSSVESLGFEDNTNVGTPAP